MNSDFRLTESSVRRRKPRIEIGMKFFSYKDELEQLLNVRVDLLSTEGLSRHVKPYLDKDKVHL